MTPTFQERIFTAMRDEVMVGAVVSLLYPGSFIRPNADEKDSDKDFTLLLPKSVEVKCDYSAAKTGNLFLEIKDRNKASGVSVSKAWAWFHYVPGSGEFYQYAPKAMYAWLRKQNQFALRTNCGDGYSEGYVVPVSAIRQLAFVKIIDVRVHRNFLPKSIE